MNTFTLKRTSYLAGILAAAFSFAHAENALKDLILTGGKKPSLSFIFSSGKSSDDFPLFFQRVDAQSGTVTLCFLETPTPLPLGKLALDAATPGIDGLAIKRVTTPSGKVFLGVEIDFAGPTPEQVDISPAGPRTLRINLPGSAPGKFKWVASKSLGASGSTTILSSTTGAAKEVPSAPSDPVAQVSTPTEPVDSKADVSEKADALLETTPSLPEKALPGSEATATEQAMLSDFSLVSGATQEDLIFKLDGLNSAFQFAAKSKDSTLYEMRVAGVKSSLKKNEFNLPLGSTFKRLNLRNVRDTLVVQIHLTRPIALQAGALTGEISITASLPAKFLMTWKASTGKTVAVPPAMVESTPSAFLAGETLEKKRSGSLSSSRVFLPTGSGKPILLLKDKVELKALPSAGAKTIGSLSAGAKLQAIGREGGWLKVSTPVGDTGFLRREAAAYVDEATSSQLQRLDKLLAAKEKAALLAQQKAEALSKKEDAKLAAAQAELANQAAKKQETPPNQDPAMTTTNPEPSSAEPAIPAAPSDSKVSAGKGEPSMGVSGNTKRAGVTSSDPANSGAKLNIPTASDEQMLSEIQDPALRARLDSERALAEKDKLKGAEADDKVTYNSYGRRDPFIPVDQGASENGIDIDQMKVVGIVWQSQDPMAALQHSKEPSVSYMVKQGDPVHNGRVARITRDAVTFDITEYGISRSYTLKLMTSQERAKK